MKKGLPNSRRKNYHRLKPRRKHGCAGMKEPGLVKCPECNSLDTRIGLRGLKCKNCGVIVEEY